MVKLNSEVVEAINDLYSFSYSLLSPCECDVIEDEQESQDLLCESCEVHEEHLILMTNLSQTLEDLEV